MFGKAYVLALLGSMYHFGFAIVSAVPFYFAWNTIAPIYFKFLPEVFYNLPYLHIVSFFLVFTYLGEQIAKLTPKLFSNS